MIERSNWIIFPTALLLAVAPQGWGATQEETPNKLQAFLAIAERNPFGLKDPPVVKPPEVQLPVVEEEPPPDVKLTGLFSINGVQRAQFLVKDQTAKSPLAKGLTLKVGEVQDGIRLVSLTPDDGIARVLLRGKESQLELKPPERPAAAIARNNAPSPNNPRVQVRSGGASPVPNLRTTREAQASGGVRVGGRSSNSDNPNAQQSRSGLRSIPTRNVRTAPQNTLTADESAMLIEVNREINRDQINAGTMPPLPPTPFTSDEDRARIVVPPPAPR